MRQIVVGAILLALALIGEAAQNRVPWVAQFSSALTDNQLRNLGTTAFPSRPYTPNLDEADDSDDRQGAVKADTLNGEEVFHLRH